MKKFLLLAATTVVLAGPVSDDNGSGATLTLGGQGKVQLAGALTAAVTVTGQVELAASFNGAGPLTLNTGGALISAGVGAYTGTVTVNDGR